MSKRHRLEKLLQNPRVWKAGRSGPGRRVLPTGFASLDAALAGGWPNGQLIELLAEPCGIGEFGVLMPALTALVGEADQSPGRWIVLVAPPHIPYAPAFAARGLNTSRLLVVRCRQQPDLLWAVEQALQSNACVAVLAWSDNADERSLRRLQLAAESAGASLFVLFRPPRHRHQRSPAALRIELRPGHDATLGLDIFKTRGGRPQNVTVPLEGRAADG